MTKNKWMLELEKKASDHETLEINYKKNLKNIKLKNCRKGRSIFHIKCRNKTVF